MKSRGGQFWLMLALLLAGGAVINLWAAAGEARVPRKSLAEFPTELGGWQQAGPDARFDAETEAVLRADDYVSRDYMTADGRAASLYVGYYLTQRTGATYHSPLNCLPGSGWELNEPGTVEVKPADGSRAFEANRYLITHGGERQLLVYWYQGRGRAVASEYRDKLYTVLDSMRLRRSDGAMVRVLVPVGGSEAEAAETAAQFAAQVAPRLAPYVPD
ncbi:MAG TPA: EpsI family protein [Pyrinomonadaceae bacterium]|jgi:EpsI family protein|nr:EpsI family protein [Pyrinomonadaceae bacterium]